VKLRPSHLLMVAAGGLMACGGSKPCPGVIQGANYDVVIQGERNPSDPSGCEDKWGFGGGTQFSAAINDLKGDDCLVGVPTLSGLTSWSFKESNTEAPAGGFLVGQYDAHFGDCAALVELKVSADAELRCFQAGQTTMDDCLLSVTLQPRSGPCPLFCYAPLSATLTRK